MSARLQESLRSEMQKAVAALYPTVSVAVSVDMPTDSGKADLVSNAAFVIGKQVGKAPTDVAAEIVAKLPASEHFSYASAKPGFINISFTSAYLRALLADAIAHPGEYGRNDLLAGQTWVVEHTSPNPNKAMHIGHLRNNLIGMALARIAAFSGANVKTDAVDNDRGIAIAKAMWGYLIFKKKDGARVEDVSYWFAHQSEWNAPADEGAKPDHFVGDCYLRGAEDFKASPASEKSVRGLVVRWEARDPQVWKLWEVVLGYAHAGIEQTLARIGNHWDKVWHEHEHYEQGRDLVLKGLADGLFAKTEDGAVVTDFKRKDLPDTILLKSDGTSLYITQDIALTKLKKAAYTGATGAQADKLIWVIGPEQSVAMKQVFACCELLGIGQASSFAHVPYGLVNIVGEDGKVKKMSSRGGEAILIDDFIDEVKLALLNAERGYEDAAAETVALGAIKYSLLRPSRMSDIVVDIRSATDLQGDSGVYLMYAYARMQSLLAKAFAPADAASIQSLAGTPAGEFAPQEHKLAAAVAYFPTAVRAALKDYAPSAIVEYLLGIAHDFNALYAQEKFVTEDPTETAKKMALTKALANIFESGFDLLGMPKVEKM